MANIRNGILSDYTRVIIRTIPDHEEYSGPIGHEVRSACDSCMAQNLPVTLFEWLYGKETIMVEVNAWRSREMLSL